MKVLRIKVIAAAIFLGIVVFTQTNVFAEPPLADLYGWKTSYGPNGDFTCTCPKYIAINCICSISR